MYVNVKEDILTHFVIFKLMNFREPLLKSLDATLDEAQLAGSSLVLDYL